MSWRLFKDTIKQPGKEYSLQTVPTLSTAKDFNVNTNQPDFMAMFDKRLDQAVLADTMREAYIRAYGYSEYDVQRLDQDMFANDIMDLVYKKIDNNAADNNYMSKDGNAIEGDEPEMPGSEEPGGMGQTVDPNNMSSRAEDNTEQIEENERRLRMERVRNQKRYGKNGNGYWLSRSDIESGYMQTYLVDVIYQTFKHIFAEARLKNLAEAEGFELTSNGVGYNGSLIVAFQASTRSEEDLKDSAKDPNSRVYSESEGDVDNAQLKSDVEITRAGVEFLTMPDRWDYIGGEFDKVFSHYYKQTQVTTGEGTHGMG